MSLRTKSRMSQWGSWAFLFLAGLAVYVTVLRLIGSETSAWLILARQNVAAFAAASFVFGWLAYEFRWDGVVRGTEATVEGEMVEVEGQGEGVGEEVKVEGQGRGGTTAGSLVKEDPAVSPSIVSPAAVSTETGFQSGEAEWVEARKLPHSFLPTMAQDEQYLTLVKRSAELGYAQALAKLGDYALACQAIVEAYYWYSCAQKRGMRNLDAHIRGIRLDWQRAGCPNLLNWYILEDSQAQSIARALLDRDAGQNTQEAKDFLASVGFT